MFITVDRRGINTDQILGWEDDGGTLTLHMTNPAPRGSFTFADTSRIELLAYLRAGAFNVAEWHQLRLKEEAQKAEWAVERAANERLLVLCSDSQGHVWDWSYEVDSVVCVHCGAAAGSGNMKDIIFRHGGRSAVAAVSADA